MNNLKVQNNIAAVQLCTTASAALRSAKESIITNGVETCLCTVFKLPSH